MILSKGGSIYMKKRMITVAALLTCSILLGSVHVYAEENEKRLQAGGISPEYFYRIFKENFPQYQIERTVSARRLDASCHEKCHPIDFLFSKNGVPVLAVVLTTQNQYRSMPFRGTEAVCDANDVSYMRFFIEMRNERNYVRERVAEELEE